MQESIQDATPAESGSLLDVFSNILTPGSSLHPTFQLFLDIAFASLFFVLVGMALLTNGNLHVIALIAIEGCLWASVKWFVKELQKVQHMEKEQEKDTNSGNGASNSDTTQQDLNSTRSGRTKEE
ncbi:V-type ATPase assembly factor Pkr1 [Abortiporus biennis]